MKTMALNKLHKRIAVLLITLSFLFSFLTPFPVPDKAGAEEIQTVSQSVYNDLTTKAVRFNFQEYVNGAKLNAYDAYVLTLSGVDATKWVFNGVSLKETIIDSAQKTINNPDSVFAKEIAYQILALDQWGGYADLIEQLSSILVGRQKHNNGSFDGDIYSDMPAFDALGRARKFSIVDAVYARDYILGNQCTTSGNVYGSWGSSWGPDFMTTAQAIRALAYLPDEVKNSEVQAAIDRGLSWLHQYQTVDGSVYYTTSGWSDDPLIDTVETILTLNTLGIDPADWQSESGQSPLDYMLENAFNKEDGSFGSYRNVMDATWALLVYANLLGGQVSNDTPLGITVTPSSAYIPEGGTQEFKSVLQYNNGNAPDITGDADWSVEDSTYASVAEKGLIKGLKAGHTVVKATYGGMTGKAVLTITAPGGGPENDCLVNIAVVGKNGELLYGPGSVLVSKTNKWGLTVLGALEATGLPYDYAEYSFGVLVTCISGQCNEGQQGWMYTINERPGGAADQEPIKNGDQIIWWYSSDPNSPGPSWNDLVKLSSRFDQETIPANLLELNKKLPVALQASDDSLAALEKVEDLLGWKGSVKSLDKPDEKIKTIAVVGNGKPVDLVALRKLKEELAKNKVELGQKITADLGAVLADANAEIALAIPARALKSDAEITVKKTGYASEKDGGNTSPPVTPPGYRQISALYSFGPAGTTFDEPVTLSLRLVIPPLVRAENLALAWYDKDEGQWKAVPAVVDLSKGLILARLKHFSDFAVFAREEKKSFADVTGDSFGWAKETIETLAGAGIVAGVDGTRFEPGRPVTRAEFTALLVKALAIPIPEKPAAAKAFKDVQDGDWFAGAATAAAQAGLVKGYADGTFRPHSAISREEAAAILARVMNLATTEQKLSFADGDKVSSWARASVAAAAAHGLVKGFPDGTFKPAAALGRAECAALVYRMLAID